MKTYAFLLIVSLAFQIGSSLKLPLLPEIKTKGFSKGGICESTINTFIESFRGIMTTGFKTEALEIPVLEPYFTDHLDLDISHEVGNVTGPIDNLRVENLSTFVTTNIQCKYAIIGLKQDVHINFTIPLLLVTGDYNLSGIAMEMIPLYGEGPFSVNITNVDVGVIITSKISTSSVIPEIKKLRVWCAIAKQDVNFQGLLYGDQDEPSLEELFNRMFSELGPTAVEDLWDDIEPYIVGKIMEKINSPRKETPLTSFVSYISDNIKKQKDKLFNFSKNLFFSAKTVKNKNK